MSTPKRRRDEDVSDAPLTLREAETSLRGAAALREALAQHSYAVVALDAADALAVRHCAEAGLTYFTSTPDATKRTHRHVFSDAGGAGLCGWNKPHAAKEVLRLRRGGPPPPVDAAAAFGVVERCACAAWCAVASLVPEGIDLQAMGCRVGSGSEGAVSSSPFDLMFYPNDAAAARVPNSTPHVDSPGLVTVIPVAATPGLRVRDRSGRWRDVEATGRPGEVIILVDAALQALSKGALEACTHEVAKAGEPRLSLVYELRPAMDVGRAILEGDWPPDEEDCPLFMTRPPTGGVSENAALAGLAALVDEDDDPPAKRRRTSVGEAQVGLALL
mmetsp:Transcript_8709/g.23635  ORF Transcript_8709/g.23635 Transcript_8709/m.23635 type:complete len:331 (-) Transcript_8709:36-1028(-)